MVWEPEGLGHVKEWFEKYKEVENEKLFNNLVYFLNKIRPVCEKYGITMAIHPDDPALGTTYLYGIIKAIHKSSESN